jgi:hypothetical protein
MKGEPVLPKHLRFFVERRNYGREVAIFGSFEDESRNFVRLLPVEAKQTESYLDMSHEPALLLHPAAAQQLIDELYTAGFRPSHGGLGDGERAAMAKHLEDMRTLVFDGAPKKAGS